MSATGALVEMAAECGGTTSPNGQQHFDVLPGDPVTASSYAGQVQQLGGANPLPNLMEVKG